ncbi:MAG: CBS domain-containing protein, partial [bacterium]
LVEFLKDANIPISPVEATLFALGIAEDTGHLAFTSTTPHDFFVMGFLHECGVQQELVNRFLTIELDPQQKALLQKLSLNLQKIRIKGLDIAFATARTREMIPEVAALTRKVQEIENADVMFALVESNGKTIIVGRSRTPNVDCNRILGYLGGGGHAGAAAATVPDSNLFKLVQDLVGLVREHAAAVVVARDIMSSPVRTISPDMTIQEGYEQVLLKGGHSGLVVTDGEGRLAGIISRKDFDKALSHNLGHAPVRGYMTRNVVFVSEDTSLEEMADVVINNNVGRLPVVFGGRVVGIVTRSDILRSLHHSSEQPETVAQSRMTPEQERAELGLRRLPARLLTLIETAANIAEESGAALYLAGGIVRDFLLDRRNTDVDLVVEGDALAVARLLAERLDLKVQYHERFGTATIFIPESWAVETRKVDLASARGEWYEHPGALPEVSQGGSYEDTSRRDFTINALALRVTAPQRQHEPVLVDHWNGLADLRAGLLRVMHPLSFVEDATRIFRAARFATRFGFAVEEETLERLLASIRDGHLNGPTAQRMRNEILLLCTEPDPGPPIMQANEWGCFGALSPGWTPVAEALATPNLLRDHLDSWALWVDPTAEHLAELALLAIMGDLPSQTLNELLQRFAFDGETIRLLQAAPERGRALRESLQQLAGSDEAVRPSQVHEILGTVPPIVVVWLAWAWRQDPKLVEFLRQETRNREVELSIAGRDLIAAGIGQGPRIGQTLAAVLGARLDGAVEGREAELALALQLAAQESPR